MGATPQELKQEIDLTRADLAANVDALAERVTPSPKARRIGAAAVASAVLIKVGMRIRARRHRQG